MNFNLKKFLITLFNSNFKRKNKIWAPLLVLFLLLLYKYGYGLKIIFLIIGILISLKKNNFYGFFYNLQNYIIKNILKNFLLYWFLLNFDINNILIYLTNDIQVDKDKEDKEDEENKESKKQLLLIIIGYTIILVCIYWFIKNGVGPQTPPPSNIDINSTNIDISTNDKPTKTISMLDGVDSDSLQAREDWHPDYLSTESESTEFNEGNLDDFNTYDYIDPVLDAYVDYESTDELYKNDEM